MPDSAVTMIPVGLNDDSEAAGSTGLIVTSLRAGGVVDLFSPSVLTAAPLLVEFLLGTSLDAIPSLVSVGSGVAGGEAGVALPEDEPFVISI